MPRKESMAVPEGNDSIPQNACVLIRGSNTLEDLRRIMLKAWDEVCEENGLKKPEKPKEMRATEQRIASLELDARQSRLAMEAGGPADTKTRERTEGAATAVQAMHGDSCSAIRVEPGPKTSSTSFGMKVEPPDLPCREDVLVEDGAAAPKSCLPSLEMRTTTAVGGLLPTGETSTATKIIFNEPPLRFSSTKETNSKETNLWTPVPSAWYGSSFWRNKLLAFPSCRRVIETKSMQNRPFDSSGSQSRVSAWPFLGSWRALLCGEVIRVGAAG